MSSVGEFQMDFNNVFSRGVQIDFNNVFSREVPNGS